jgi:mannose-6-phosphate isomerase-like protein (cupin superfamily)
MVISKNDTTAEEKTKVRGGEGTVIFKDIVPPELLTNARLLTQIELPPGSSIGYHEHVDETEYYIIISGTATVNDNGTEKQLRKGDVLITGNGGSHSITATGKTPCVFIAIIITR